MEGFHSALYSTVEILLDLMDVDEMLLEGFYWRWKVFIGGGSVENVRGTYFNTDLHLATLFC